MPEAGKKDDGDVTLSEWSMMDAQEKGDLLDQRIEALKGAEERLKMSEGKKDNTELPLGIDTVDSRLMDAIPEVSSMSDPVSSEELEKTRERMVDDRIPTLGDLLEEDMREYQDREPKIRERMADGPHYIPLRQKSGCACRVKGGPVTEQCLEEGQRSPAEQEELLEMKKVFEDQVADPEEEYEHEHRYPEEPVEGLPIIDMLEQLGRPYPDRPSSMYAMLYTATAGDVERPPGDNVYVMMTADESIVIPWAEQDTFVEALLRWAKEQVGCRCGR